MNFSYKTKFIEFIAMLPEFSGSILRVLLGNASLQLSSFVVSVIIAREVVKEQFANFIVCLISMELLRFFAQFGFRLSTIRLSMMEKSHGRPEAPILTASIALQMGAAFAVFCTVFYCAPVISKVLLQDGELSNLLRIVSFNALSISLFQVILVDLNLRQEFNSIALYNISLGFVRLAAVILSLQIFSANIEAVMVAWVTCPFFLCVFYRRRFLRIFRGRAGWVKWLMPLLNFSIWVFCGTILTMICNRLDFYLLNWQQVKPSVADYGVAITLATVIKVYSGSAGMVLFPRMCHQATQNDDIRTVMLNIGKISLGAFFIIIILAVLAWPIINILYGEKYRSAYLITVILSVGYMFFLLQDLSAQVFTAYGRPGLRLVLNAIQLFLLFGIGIILIPRYLAIGAAVSVALMYACGVFTVFILYFWHVRLRLRNELSLGMKA